MTVLTAYSAVLSWFLISSSICREIVLSFRMPRWKSKMPPISRPCLLVISSRSWVSSTTASAIEWPSRSDSIGTWAASIVRLGITRSSASSTTAVLITTPGETPMPFLISIVNRGSEVGGRGSEGASDLRPPTHDPRPSFFSELAREQLHQFLHRLLRVRPFRFDAQRRALGGGEDDHLHHALAVRFRGLLAA